MVFNEIHVINITFGMLLVILYYMLLKAISFALRMLALVEISVQGFLDVDCREFWYFFWGCYLTFFGVIRA